MCVCYFATEVWPIQKKYCKAVTPQKDGAPQYEGPRDVGYPSQRRIQYVGTCILSPSTVFAEVVHLTGWHAAHFRTGSFVINAGVGLCAYDIP